MSVCRCNRPPAAARAALRPPRVWACTSEFRVQCSGVGFKVGVGIQGLPGGNRVAAMKASSAGSTL